VLRCREGLDSTTTNAEGGKSSSLGNKEVKEKCHGWHSVKLSGKKRAKFQYRQTGSKRGRRRKKLNRRPAIRNFVVDTTGTAGGREGKGGWMSRRVNEGG